MMYYLILIINNKKKSFFWSSSLYWTGTGSIGLCFPLKKNSLNIIRKQKINTIEKYIVKLKNYLPATEILKEQLEIYML